MILPCNSVGEVGREGEKAVLGLGCGWGSHGNGSPAGSGLTSFMSRSRRSNTPHGCRTGSTDGFCRMFGDCIKSSSFLSFDPDTGTARTGHLPWPGAGFKGYGSSFGLRSLVPLVSRIRMLVVPVRSTCTMYTVRPIASPASGS